MKSQKYFWQVLVGLIGLSLGSSLCFYILNRLEISAGQAFLILIPFQVAVAIGLASRLRRPIDVLRVAIRRIRIQLRRRIQTISSQKNEQDALLSSMAEGVVAVDRHLRIMQLNKAAGRILKVDPRSAVGRTLHEVIRVPQVLQIVDHVRQRNESSEQDIELINELTSERTRHLQVQAGPLSLAKEDSAGVVLVFSDVTRIRELEGMRRNFVSNVSHELRTPLTSIQGFAETLLNPAVKDPDEIKKFLQIIQRHAARLGRIIEDILTLSSIERDAESNQIELKIERLRPMLSATVELYNKKADNKKIKVELVCDDDLTAPIDPYLIEQAVINLVDNAIRYSDEGQPIRVEAEKVASEVLIRVIDHGIGIAEKQLPRIFERFYRVDKARSRELGGTGLGLSIVKHISLAHRGSVDVESQPGKGSCFTIRLPADLPPVAMVTSPSPP